MATVVGLQFQDIPLPVGDVGVIANSASSEPDVGLTLRTMRRTGLVSGSVRKGVYSASATSAAPSIQ